MLYLRAQMPGQSHQSGRRTGQGGDRERCIACGSCIKVCRQEAKAVRDSISPVKELFWNNRKSHLACLAPSFPAAFPQVKPGQIISAVPALGFAEVMEVAFGADLVARAHARWARKNGGRLYISSPCPASGSLHQKILSLPGPEFNPDRLPDGGHGTGDQTVYGPGAKVVFIGPCIAKKAEIDDPEVAGDVDAVFTFVELEPCFRRRASSWRRLPESDPDGPTPVGAHFPVPGGLLRSAAMKEDICRNQILVTEGKEACTQILNELLEGAIEAKFLDLLFCEGCINGPAFPKELSVFCRKELVANYVQERLTKEREDPPCRRHKEIRKVEPEPDLHGGGPQIAHSEQRNRPGDPAENK